MNKDSLAFLYETCNEGEVAFIKSILDANGIAFVVENEFITRGPGIPMLIKVKAEQKDKARELLKDFNL